MHKIKIKPGDVYDLRGCMGCRLGEATEIDGPEGSVVFEVLCPETCSNIKTDGRDRVADAGGRLVKSLEDAGATILDHHIGHGEYDAYFITFQHNDESYRIVLRKLNPAEEL